MKKVFKVVLMAMLVGSLTGCSIEVTLPKTTTEDLLPFGSVVLLKESNKRIMIYGHQQELAGDETNKMWDYAACYYPEGRLNNESSFVFDTEYIERVDFEGLTQLSEATLQTEVGEKWLPIGSVVEVAGANEPLIIIGRYQKNGDTGEIYDYIGCSYETGNVGVEYTWIFNQDMISGLYFTGYEDEEEMAFEERLNSID